MCDDEDYNPDTDITNYGINELLSMYRRSMERDGILPRTSLFMASPFFTRDELKEEINSRAIGQYLDYGQYALSLKKNYYNVRDCAKENFSPMIAPLWESFSENNVQVEIIFWSTGEFVWINIAKKWIVKNS